MRKVPSNLVPDFVIGTLFLVIGVVASCQESLHTPFQKKKKVYEWSVFDFFSTSLFHVEEDISICPRLDGNGILG